MGEQKVTAIQDKKVMNQFIKALLKDMQALEYMLDNDWFETDTIRIGAEQEMCLVDRRTFKPAPIAMEVLEKLRDHPWAETELARFNLEINLDPQVFSGSCIRDIETQIETRTAIIRQALSDFDADLLLAGILPTIRKHDLEIGNLTPKKRYFSLIDAIRKELMGKAFELRLTGIDELLVKHDSALMEACNTSFQVHLQVRPDQFVQMYNIAQALAGPIMAISANSPLVFGRRLWHESRIALFQQALDVRTTHDHMRERSPRVSFGTGWLDQSILEIYKEDIARFRVILASETEEDALQLIRKGKVPKLKALQVHNSTVYRWNRPCYGISDNGQPHLRIENRVLPAGPSIVDEVANAALWLGAMVGYTKQFEDIRRELVWEDVRDNFGKAAQFGVDTKFNWFGEGKISACDLVVQEILPLAREGLQAQGIDPKDIDHYLGIIEERAQKHTNGARWQIKAFTKLKAETSSDEALSVVTYGILKNQRENNPVHNWKIPDLADLPDYRPSRLKVEEFMQTDLFTVHKEDPIELVGQLMDWRELRFMPVEDTQGQLSGLITSRLVMRHFANPTSWNGKKPTVVEDIMIRDPQTIGPSATIIEAMRLMRENNIGCLPVVNGSELIGIITENDFLRISARLIERLENWE